MIENYPDGLVDINDINFISSKYGLWEGHSGWDYMADVIPNRLVDIDDITEAAVNFGKFGTYITDLEGVTITFDTSEETSPDDNGFITIPQAATCFNVTRYGNPIGATIIFW